MKFRIAIDSGAFSLFNKYSKNKNDQRGGSDFSFYDTQKFSDYFDKYVAFMKALPPVEYYITMDVIFNPERTYSLWKDLRKMGLNPLPVVHFGEDQRWLKKYLDDCDYVCFGGLGSRAGSVQQYDEWADGMFKLVTDARGRPTHKIHGLALTQYDLLLRYPWYSVDSTTPFRASNNGMMQIPQANVVGGKIEFDYCGRPYWFPCTERRANAAAHVSKHGEWYDKVVRTYLDQFGFTLEQASDDYFVRNVVSILYYMQLERALSAKREYPFLFYASGKASGFNDEMGQRFFGTLDKIGLGELDYNFLGTFFDVRTFNSMITTMENYHGKGKAAPVAQAGRPRLARSGLHSNPHSPVLQKRPPLRIR